jgi:hypothetical protein
VLRLLRVAYGNAPHARRDLPEHRQPLAGEHDRDRAALPLQRGDDRGHMREDYIGLQGDQFFCKRLKLICPVSREATAMRSGHTAAAPPRSLMNSRRCIFSPRDSRLHGHHVARSILEDQAGRRAMSKNAPDFIS